MLLIVNINIIGERLSPRVQEEEFVMISKKGILVTIISILFVLSCGGGGSDDSGGGGGGTNDEFIQSIIDDFVDNVVIPTYNLLRIRATNLREACEALEADPTEENLEAARDAWFAARVPWEQSEAWLFGPVDFKGHDPALDSWPVNRTDLDAVLAGDDELTEEFVRNLDPTLKGFHTAEYLLFAFAVDELGAREFEYLISVVRDIESTAEELYTDWTQGDEPFGEIMKDAGNNSVFPSQVSALEQIIEGMSIILDEVANGKIAEPFDNQDVEAVESQFSFNSRQDFANDIRGALHAYTGDHPGLGLTGTGLDELVAETDPELADRMEDEINAAITAILAIPQPFRDAILDPDAADEIVAAQEACRQAFDTLNEEVLPVVQQ
jgi:uncharacterized iron-regulated protein